MNPYVPLAIAALEDLLDDLHLQGNTHYFQARFVDYGDSCKQEALVALAIKLVRQLPAHNPLPTQMHGDQPLAS